MVNLYWAVASGETAVDPPFDGLTTTPNPHYQNGKIDLCAYHCRNYFARLVPEMRLFSKVLKRS